MGNVVIGKKSFKDSYDFLEYLECSMEDFLQDINKYPIYTYPANSESTYESEEGIEFYYTRLGQKLVDRWIERMKLVFDKYFPEDEFEEPRCIYYKNL